jgi:CBS domain containing-hemolysin-like protein
VIVLLIATIVAGTALFEGLETGFVSLMNRVGLRVRARRGDAAAARLLRLTERPERVLATFLVGNTLFNVVGGALVANWMVGMLPGREALASVIATTLGLGTVLLVLGQMAPKSYFRIRGEAVVPRFLWFIRLISFLFAPVAWAASGLLGLATRGSGRNPFVTREELRQLVKESGGGLTVRERRMLDSLFDFGRTVVREVLIPLPEVVSVPDDATRAEVLELARRQRYTRFPVYRERVDRVVGLVSVFDLLYEPEKGAGVAAYLRPIHVVPDVSRIQRVLVDLQRRRESMALVVNELGACLGIVTMADIVEEIMGELADEHAERPRPLVRSGDGYLVDASMNLDDLGAELGVTFRRERVDTIGGLVLHHLGRIPQAGETLRVEGIELEVVSAHAYGISRLKLRMVSPSRRAD